MKHLIIVGIAVLLIVVGLGGCINNNGSDSEYSTFLPDGTKIIGDIQDIQILEHDINRYKEISWSYTLSSRYFEISYTNKIPDYMDLSDIDTNLTTRENFCLEYVEPVVNNQNLPITWNDDYWGYTLAAVGGDVSFRIIQFSPGDDIVLYGVNGTSKNIGNDFLDHPKISVNYYNKDGAWLAELSDLDDDIPSGYTWDFDIWYSGEFVNDVSYISFEVTASVI